MSSDAPQDPVCRDLVYVVSNTGHRQSYLDFFSSRFSLAPIQGTMSVDLFIRLLKARRLLFATLDDDMFWFTIIAVFRSVLFKPTAAMFLRPQKCFEREKTIYRMKWLMFRILRMLPKQILITITPFSADPRLQAVANASVLDPQYFDMLDGRTIRPPSEGALVNQLQLEARGRPILCFPGSLTRMKGFNRLVEAIECAPGITESLLIVCAGQVETGCESHAARFEGCGGHLIDRRISDLELENLYKAADFIWCCYEPEYDQASGIFGRAMQWQVPVILRSGSTIHKIATEFTAGHVAASDTSPQTLAKTLLSLLNPTENTQKTLSIDEQMNTQSQLFNHVVSNALAGKSKSIGTTSLQGSVL